MLSVANAVTSHGSPALLYLLCVTHVAVSYIHH
jgi:hypothetical protein